MKPPHTRLRLLTTTIALTATIVAILLIQSALG